MEPYLINIRKIFLLMFLVLLSACEEIPVDEKNQEVNFKSVLNGGEHYFRRGTVDEYINSMLYKVSYTDSFGFKTYSEYLIDNNLYTIVVWNYLNQFTNDSVAGYVFYPVRYSQGKYYEKRDNNFEPVILKDGIQVGDNWLELNNDDMKVDTFRFVVTDFYDSLVIANNAYYNVYLVKESYAPGDKSHSDYENYKFYNQEFGLLKMILPPYYSDFYTKGVYERLEKR